MLKKLILCTALLLVIFIGINSVHSQQPDKTVNKQEKKIMTNDELEKFGKQLRRDIEESLNDLSKQNRLVSGDIAIDISEIALKYIHVGMSLKDSLVILKSANINYATVDKDPKNKFILGSATLSNFPVFINASIWIYPKIPNDLNSEIGEVSGIISYPSL